MRPHDDRAAGEPQLLPSTLRAVYAVLAASLPHQPPSDVQRQVAYWKKARKPQLWMSSVTPLGVSWPHRRHAPLVYLS